MYLKKPLIYMPRKKGNTTIINPTDVMGSIFIGSDYINYYSRGPAVMQTPSRICTNPEQNLFAIRGKRLNFTRTGSNNEIRLVPITGEVTTGGSLTIPQRADFMRWAPIWPSTLYAQALYSMPYVFYIYSNTTGSQYNDAVLKFKDSAETNQYSFGAMIVNEPYTTTPATQTMQWHKIRDNDGDITRIYNKIVSLNISTTGCLFLTNIDFSVWTDSVLLDFANYALNTSSPYFGTKSRVIEIDLNT